MSSEKCRIPCHRLHKKRPVSSNAKPPVQILSVQTAVRLFSDALCSGKKTQRHEKRLRNTMIYQALRCDTAPCPHETVSSKKPYLHTVRLKVQIFIIPDMIQPPTAPAEMISGILSSVIPPIAQTGMLTERQTSSRKPVPLGARPFLQSVA